MRNLRFTVAATICSLLIISLFSIHINAQQEEYMPGLLSARGTLMIPRVTKPWSEALLFVGNGKTLYSDFTFIRDKKSRWHTMGCFGIEPDGVGNGWAVSDGYSMFHAVGSSLDKPMKLLPKIHYQINTPKQAIMWAPGAMACSMVSTYASKYPSDHDLEGIYIQPLKWEKADAGMEKRITRKH